MSENNTTILIGLLGVMITSVVVPLVTHWLASAKLEQQNRKLEQVESVLMDTKTDVTCVKEDVHAVHVATNSMREQLVKAADLVGEARGIKMAQDAQKIEDAQRAQGAASQMQRQADLDAPGKTKGE